MLSRRICLALLIVAVAATFAYAQRGISVNDGPGNGNRRVALVIGNGGYASSPLRNPVNDARLMARTLRDLGFEVIEGENLDLNQMKRAVRNFGGRLGQNSVGLFYYAGHGMQVNGLNYLIPVGARIDSEFDVELEGLDVRRVLVEMREARNRLNLVFLDACRDNPFARSFRTNAKGLAQMPAPSGTLIAYATAPGSTAADGSGRNGVFTEVLARQMTQPGLMIESVLKRTRREVSRRTGGKQIPWDSSSLIGDFYFKGGATQPQPAPTAQPVTTSQAVPQIPISQWPRRITNSIGMEFVLIPAGSFTMGSPISEPKRHIDEGPRHRVTISKPFYMQTTEVTQGQWKRVMGNNPSNFSSCGSNCPVEVVSWNDAQDFIRKLNAMEGGNKYRLPTEAQWEYATRADNTSSYYFGNDSNQLRQYGWYICNSGGKTHPVAGKKPNRWGLYDMHGNVWEWCNDWYAAVYYSKSPSGDPQGPNSGNSRVLRGGSWGDDAWVLRSADRIRFHPDSSNRVSGFRLTRITP